MEFMPSAVVSLQLQPDLYAEQIVTDRVGQA
jgi:hypothetical protein